MGQKYLWGKTGMMNLGRGVRSGLVKIEVVYSEGQDEKEPCAVHV